MGFRYQPVKKDVEITLQSGVENTRESYAFLLTDNEIQGSIRNSNIIFKGGFGFSLAKRLWMSAFVEIVPDERSSVGFAFNYPIIGFEK